MGRRALLLAGAAAVGVAALAGFPSLRRLGRGDVPTVVVRRSDFVRKVQAEGNLKAVEATPLSAPIDAPGPMKIAWLAPDGSRVRAGDVVIRFDPTEMEKNLVDGRSERETVENRIEGRRAEGEGTVRNLERDAAVAGLELRYAREFQSKDPEIFSRTQIIESQIDEGLATRRKETAEAVRDTRERLATVDVDLLEIEKRKAQLKVSQAEKGLGSLEVRAPHDGILVFQREWRGIPKVGDTVWKGTVLAEIPQLDAMKAEVYVLEADAGGVTAGKPAEVRLEAHPGRVFAAKVGTVDALAKPRVSWVPVQYFGVTLDLETTDPALMKPGQRVNATLLLEEKKNALAVPRGAVFEKDGKKIVYRRKRWGFETVPVTLGPSAIGRVVVETGLEDGDEIALRDPARAPDGSAGEEAAPSPAAPSGAAAGGIR